MSPFDSSAGENVNLQNGNVNLSIPLASLPRMAGGKLGFTIYAHYNSKLWDTRLQQRIRCQPGDGCVPYNVSVPYESQFGGWRIGGTYGIRWDDAEYWDYERDPNYYGLDQNLFLNNNWVKAHFFTPDGSKHEIRPLGKTPFWGVDDFYRGYYKDTPDTSAAPMRYYTTDGSYIWLTIYPSTSPDLKWEAHMPDGTKIEQFATFQRISDTTGNKVKIFSDAQETHYQDEYTGREIRVGQNSTTGKNGVSYQSVGGSWQTVEIIYGTTDVSGKFVNVDYPDMPGNSGCTYQEHATNIPTTLSVVREIRLPQTQSGQPQPKYTFSYNSDIASQNDATYISGCGAATQTYVDPSMGWGELSEMTVPSGAEHKYSYDLDDTHTVGGTGANSEIDAASNTITSKQVVHDGETDTWSYNINNYNASVSNPDGSSRTLKMYTQGGDGFGGLAYRETSSGNVRVERRWERLVFDGGYEYTNGFNKLAFNPVVTAEFVSLLDASGNPTLMSAKTFEHDYNGNVTRTVEYDWFSPALVTRDTVGVPIAVPASAIALRTTDSSFHNSPSSSASTDVYAKTSNPFLSALKETIVGPSVTRISYDSQSFGVAPTIGNITGTSSWNNVNNQWVSTSTTYSARGNVTSTTDPNGNATHIIYGSINGYTDLYPTQTVLAYGTPIARTSSASYDFYTGFTTSNTDEDNDLTNSVEYDILGRPVKTISAVGEVGFEAWTVSEYHDAERYVVSKADLETVGDGKKVAIQHYDQLGRVRLSRTLENAATEDPTNEQHGIKVETRYKTESGYTYQLTSNPYRTTAEPTMGWTLATAWSNGRRSEVETFTGAGLPTVFGGGNTNSTGIVRTDIDAERTLVTDQAGKRRISKTNALGQLKEVWEILAASATGSESVAFPNTTIAHGFKTTYAYDALNNLTTVTQGSQTPREFMYSSLSRLLSASNPESGTISYGYDPNGNLTAKTDARSIVTTYTYDVLNRITARDYTDSTPDVDYTYSLTAPSVGKLVKVESSVSTTEYTGFDILGRVTAHKQTTDGQQYTTEYAYNLSGALIEQTYPSGRVVKNTLDVDGSLSQVQSKRSGETFRNYANGFNYNAAGAVSSMRLGNGLWETTHFNSRLQPTQIGLGLGSATPNKLKLDYEYGTTASVNNGNVSQQTITVPGVAHPFVQTYTYDELNRLTNAEEIQNSIQTWEQTFTFDRFGNRNFDEANTTTLPKNCGSSPNFTVCTADRKIVNPTVNTANNRLSTSDNYAFDNAGNTTGDAEGRTFVYDAENMQISVSDGSGTIGQYSYDGDRKRIKKYVPDTREITIFVYDAAGKQIAEYSTIVQTGNDAKIVYTTSDNLGSPRINTDANGAVTARHDYMPFGEEVYTSQRTSALGYTADTIRKQFTGYERDTETGLDFAQARYAMLKHGRFTSPDPYVIQFEMKKGRDVNEQREMFNEYLAEPRNHNRYVYGLNNPLKYTDPTGMRPPNYWEQKGLDKLQELAGMARYEGNTELADALLKAKDEISAIIAKLKKNKTSRQVGIAVFAILQVDSDDGKKYADDQRLATPGYTYGNESKCNVFVAMAHINGGGVKPSDYPSENGKFAVANWLGDSQDRMKLKNLPVHWGAAGVGDVVAWRNTNAERAGHSGISIGGGVMVYAGGNPDGRPQVRTISDMSQRMTASRGLSGPAHEPGVIRRYNGKP